MDFDLFISHKTADDTLVTQLAAGLESVGIRCYVDHIARDYNKWTDLVARARSIPVLLLLLTPNSCDDDGDNLVNEVMAAKNAKHTTIPVFTPDIEFGQGSIGGQYMGYSWIKWDPSNGVDDVAEAVRRRLEAVAGDGDRRPAPTGLDTTVTLAAKVVSTYTVHSRTPRVSVSLKRDAPGYPARKAAIVRRFGPASGDRWALTPQEFEEFARLAQSEH